MFNLKTPSPPSFPSSAAESMSSFSLQQSVSELPDLDARRGTGSSIDLSSFTTPTAGKPHESLVLQLHGMEPPSSDLIERLSYVIQYKLDDAALEMMCSLYARNQRLKLTPADVQFLQLSHSEPSHSLSIDIPSWVREVEALAFYFVQVLSVIAMKPRYTSNDHREHFQVPQALQNAYVMTNLPVEAHQDHLFLYIRPQTKGRGMAVICVSLATPHGEIYPPQPGVIAPAFGSCPLAISGWSLEDLNCEVSESTEATGVPYNVCVVAWLPSYYMP